MPARILQFGDGCEQTGLAGLSSQQTTWDVEVIIASAADDALFNAFLLEHGQHRSFEWQSPRDTALQLYRITGDISSTRRNGGGSKPVFFSRRMQFKNTGLQVQSSIDPDTVLLMQLNTASGLTDLKSKIITNSGTTSSTAILDPFGGNNGVRYFDGLSTFSIEANNDFSFGNRGFTIEGWFYFLSFPNAQWGIFDYRPPSYPGSDKPILTGNTDVNQGIGRIGWYEGTYAFSAASMPLNQWLYICVSRSTAGYATTRINGGLVATNLTRINTITCTNDILIGGRADIDTSYNGKMHGYASNLRISTKFRNGSIVPTQPFQN